jgi:hypothetical protein
MANQATTAKSSQRTAEEKKILGSGKKERNTARLLGAGKVCHVTAAKRPKQE